jgi:transcriptional regulator with XRE-family HTH domain
VPTRASHPILKRVGARVRKLRTGKGWSQERLAFTAKMDRSYLSGLERGEFNVSIVALAKLARALDVRLGMLIDSD